MQDTISRLRVMLKWYRQITKVWEFTFVLAQIDVEDIYSLSFLFCNMFSNRCNASLSERLTFLYNIWILNCKQKYFFLVWDSDEKNSDWYYYKVIQITTTGLILGWNRIIRMITPWIQYFISRDQNYLYPLPHFLLI